MTGFLRALGEATGRCEGDSGGLLREGPTDVLLGSSARADEH
ncbi:MAG: hypothetical protein ACYDEV_00860 [Acidiferrobacter sp.]